MKKYDIFISYRRDGGEATAKIIRDSLTGMGYRVFFDVESLRSGEFNQELYRVIEECGDVLVILSPGSLDRCKNEDDWVRREIAHTMKNRKNIVPVMLRGFAFPEILPEEIDGLRWMNGIEASTEFYDAFIRKLTTFLVTKPTMKNRLIQNYVVRRILPAALAILLAIVAAGGGWMAFSRRTAVFPRTASEKNMVREAVAYVSGQLSYANQALANYGDVMEICTDYVAGQAGVTREEALSQIDYAAGRLFDCRERTAQMDGGLSGRMDDSPLPKDDFVALYTYLQVLYDGMEDDFTFLSGYLQMDGSSLTTQQRYIRQLQEFTAMEKDILFYGTNEMFLAVAPEALTEFKSQMLPAMTSIYDGQTWLSDKVEIEGILNRNLNAMEGKTGKLAAIVGNDQRELDRLKADSRRQTTKYLTETYSPLDTDDQNALWSKMLIFHHYSMAEEALACLDLYEQKDGSAEAAIFVAAARTFLEKERETGYSFGCLVAGYEDPKQPHRQLKIGDFVVAVNGQPVRDAGELSDARKKIGMDAAYAVTVLRFDGDAFRIFEEQIEAGQTLILYYSMDFRPEAGEK